VKNPARLSRPRGVFTFSVFASKKTKPNIRRICMGRAPAVVFKRVGYDGKGFAFSAGLYRAGVNHCRT